MKTLLKISLLAFSASLISCVPANSKDPVGDAFTNASNVIGNAVNSVVEPPTTQPSPH